MTYFWYNKQELLQEAKGKYDNGGKEKAAEYYQVNKKRKKQKQSIARICIKNERKYKRKS